MSSPDSIDDLLGASSGSDFDVDMSDGNPSPPASPEKDAAAPAAPPRPAPLQLPDDNQAVNAGIADASSGTPKRQREADPFFDTLGGKEYVQRILNAGTRFKASPKAEFSESRKQAGVAVTYRITKDEEPIGIGGKQLIGGKFYEGIR